MSLSKQVNVFFAFFPYAGNGGTNAEHPSIRKWFAKTYLNMKGDDRIGDINVSDFSDTPITMTRNRAVQTAKACEADVLVMCDSDMHPDLYLGKYPTAKPFWDSSFEFLMKWRSRGPTVIGAPYCGPPPYENVYVFRPASYESDHPNCDFRIEQFTREEAAIRGGLEDVIALPTGLIMFDMRAFKTIKPPYFYYEYTDEFQQEKASTEDVTCTRDMALCGREELGYNPVYVNWDAWAGHYKPKCVGKPMLLTVDKVNDTYKEAVIRNQRSDEQMVVL